MSVEFKFVFRTMDVLFLDRAANIELRQRRDDRKRQRVTSTLYVRTKYVVYFLISLLYNSKIVATLYRYLCSYNCPLLYSLFVSIDWIFLEIF